MPLSMEQTIRMVLENNDDVAMQQLDILKSDTELLKNESLYSPVLEGGYHQKKTIDKKSPGNISSGNMQDTGRSYAKIKKMFKSGTYFEIEGSDTRIDYNAQEVSMADQLTDFNTSNVMGTFPYVPIAPIHQSALSVVLRQELLKNAFGYNQARANEIHRNESRMQRLNLTYHLTGIVVQAMINYWSLNIAEEQYKTSQVLLKNTKNIYNVTLKKRRLGLAEYFEVNQWDALLARARTNVNMTRLDRNKKRKDLLRIMNLDPDLKLNGQTTMLLKYPDDLKFKEDLAYAFKNRPDLQSLTIQRINAHKSLEISENQLLPSVSIGGTYSSRGYGRHAHLASRGVSHNKYPEYGVKFKVEYPLWDEGAKVDVRNSRIDVRKINIQERKLKRQIRDEIEIGIEQIKVTHAAVQDASLAMRSTQSFFNGLMRRYRQGRFTAIAVKEALDQLVQSRQAYTEAIVNYNISLVRYDFIRNKIFVKYNINIAKVVDRLGKYE